jgi:hypothetical protein
MLLTAPTVTGSDKPLISVSAQALLAAINAQDVLNGGPGDTVVSGATVSCYLDSTSNPAFPDTTPSSHLVGGVILNNDVGAASQYFSGGVEGADYILHFALTFSNGEIATMDVRVVVRKNA